MQPELYRETVRLPLWVTLIIHAAFWGSLWLWLAFRGAVAEATPSLLWAWDLMAGLPCAACVIALVGLGRLTISIQDRVLKLRFGLIPMTGKEIPLDLVAAAEAVEYRPIREFGGWGIRRGRFRGTPTAVYSLKGSSGVLLTLEVSIDTLFLRTQQILIGNQTPDQLAASLRQSIAA